jgi:hypothetical protein
LVPVPQYPLYSAIISLFGGSLVPYYLEEEANWNLDFANIRQAVAEARSKGITVSVLLLVIVLIKISLLLLVIPVIHAYGICHEHFVTWASNNVHTYVCIHSALIIFPLPTMLRFERR